MANNSNPKQNSNEAELGTINPSAPTAGTEGGTNSKDNREDQKLHNNSREASSPNAKGAGDVRKTSYPASDAGEELTPQPPASAATDDLGRMGDDRKKALEENPNNRAGKSFRCADVGVENCNWSVSGTNEDDIVGKVRKHAKEQHQMSDQDFDKMSDKVRGAITGRNKAA